MLTFCDEFGENFLYTREKDQAIYTEENPKGLFTTLMHSKGFRGDVLPKGLLSPEQLQRIDAELMPEYDAIHAQMPAIYEGQ